MAQITTDVVIVGGGPVGSLIAYELARFGVKPYIIEQDDKRKMPCYGRATTLWPRTIEILDQIDLAERLIQIGVVTRSGLHFHDGKRSHGGLMYGSRMDKLGDTFFKFALHLRQRLSEEQFTDALSEYNVAHQFERRIEGYTIDESVTDGYPVTVKIRNIPTDKLTEVKTKYLIGSDGGKSTVRKLASIPFSGENTKSRWIRMDAVVKTNMPNPRSLNSIDSASHGQILWCPNDNGLTRIGFVFSQALIDKYGGESGVTKEVVMAEAKVACQPFDLEFVRVDWFTIYGIGQRIADTFCVDDRVLLAGDACHTHSSGSAQGLNTGIHDSINLAWKLALRIRGLAKKSLLDSYDSERRPIVQHVIDNDKTISMLISGQYPPQFQGRPEPTRDILTEWFDDLNRQSFTLGLSIAYPLSVLNAPPTDLSRCVINAGERGPDVYLSTIGTGDPIRLHQVIKNNAIFHIIIFAGNPFLTRPHLLSLETALASSTSFINIFPRSLFQFTTITTTSGNGAQEVLRMAPFGSNFTAPEFGLEPDVPVSKTRFAKGSGRVFFDEKVAAHEIYGVDWERGAVVVVRPDGWVGATTGLDDVERLGPYFDGFLERV